MTSRHEYRPLSSYPPQELSALRSPVSAVLRYEHMLSADLYVKLDLLRDDITIAVNRSTPRGPIFTPRSGTGRKGKGNLS